MSAKTPTPTECDATGCSDGKEKYVPPEVHFIKVTVSEALMAVCKGGVGSGFGAPAGCSGIEGPCVGGGS